MSAKQYETERDLQHRFEAVLAQAWPEIEVLDVEYDAPREQVRLFVDRQPGGVDVEVCTRVTHMVREQCPELGLEVSSPGIERPLRKLEHFDAAAGKRVKIRLRGDRRPFHATIVETAAGDDADSPGIVVVRRAGHESTERIEIAQLTRAKLDVSDEISIGTPKPKPGQARNKRPKPGPRQPSTPTKGQA